MHEFYRHNSPYEGVTLEQIAVGYNNAHAMAVSLDRRDSVNFIAYLSRTCTAPFVSSEFTNSANKVIADESLDSSRLPENAMSALLELHAAAFALGAEIDLEPEPVEDRTVALFGRVQIGLELATVMPQALWDLAVDNDVKRTKGLLDDSVPALVRYGLNDLQVARVHAFSESISKLMPRILAGWEFVDPTSSDEHRTMRYHYFCSVLGM